MTPFPVDRFGDITEEYRIKLNKLFAPYGVRVGTMVDGVLQLHTIYPNK